MNDLISRQAAIDAVGAALLSWSYMPEWRDNKIVEAVEQLPPAQPERIRGRWILAKEQRREDIENGNYMYNCSNCGCGDLHSRAVNVSYCWNCGADMREVTS